MRKKLHYTNTEDHKRARELRHNASPVEQKFWAALQKAAVNQKVKFRRQQPIHPYIADFACMKAKLLIELDGMSHDGRVDYDKARDEYLKKQGYTVLRISNDEVTHNMISVVETILRDAEELLKQSHPLTSKN